MILIFCGIMIEALNSFTIDKNGSIQERQYRLETTLKAGIWKRCKTSGHCQGEN